MGKDGAGGSSGGPTGGCGGSCKCATKQDNKTTYDLHIETLKLIGLELERLHDDLANEYGDTDTTQGQITAVINQLNQLSLMLGENEVS